MWDMGVAENEKAEVLGAGFCLWFHFVFGFNFGYLFFDPPNMAICAVSATCGKLPWCAPAKKTKKQLYQDPPRDFFCQAELQSKPGWYGAVPVSAGLNVLT